MSTNYNFNFVINVINLRESRICSLILVLDVTLYPSLQFKGRDTYRTQLVGSMLAGLKKLKYLSGHAQMKRTTTIIHSESKRDGECTWKLSLNVKIFFSPWKEYNKKIAVFCNNNTYIRVSKGITKGFINTNRHSGPC